MLYIKDIINTYSYRITSIFKVSRRILMVILNAGKPKTGKTVTFLTFPGLKLSLDYDGGLISYKHARWDKAYPEFGMVKGDLIVPESEWSNIYSIQMYVEKPVKLELNTPDKNDFKMGKAPDYTEDGPRLVGKHNKVMDELYEDGCVPKRLLYRDPKLKLPPLTEAEGEERVGPFTSIAIDTATQMYRIWKAGVMNVNRMPRLSIPDYATLQDMFFQSFVPTLKSLNTRLRGILGHEPWIFVLVHEDIEKDDLTGAIQEFPVGPSRSQGKSISEAFDESWRQVIELGEYKWRTRDHGRWESAGSRTHIPDNMAPACYATLKKHFKEE